MIISHKHKFIFIAIPKTGSHTIRFALRPFLDKNDEEHVSLFHSSKLPYSGFKNRVDGHISASEIKPFLTPEIWNSYFKFCFVRNPWDRFISSVFFRNKTLQLNPEFAESFVQKTLAKELISPKLFYRDQLSYILNDKEDSLVDFIGKTENLDQDLKYIFDKIGLPYAPTKPKNKSEHKHYSTHCSEKHSKLIMKKYEKDIAFFKYHYENINQ